MRKLWSKALLFLCAGAALFGNSCSVGETSASSADSEHLHSYVSSFVEPTRAKQGYTLHACSCGEAYADGYTGISGIKETNKPEYRILFIGNSYTYFNNLWDIFALAANGEGYSVEIDHITQGGYSLKQMADPRDPFGAEVEKALAGEKYDAVFLQEQSLLPATNPAAFYDGVRALAKKIKNNGAAGVLYQTWARRPDSADLAANGLTHESMTMKLAAAYEAIAKECGLFLSQTGSAFYNITLNHPEIELYDSDKTHPSLAGSYLAAICHYAVIYGKSPIGISYARSIGAEKARILQNAAHEAVFGQSIVTKEYAHSSEGVTETPETESDWRQDGILKILTIGNSFSDDTMEYVGAIAKSIGVKNISLGNLYYGGCSLNMHYNYALNNSPVYDYRTNTGNGWRTKSGCTMQEAILAENWDFISLQQGTGDGSRFTRPQSYANLPKLIDYVKKKADKSAQLIWNMTWSDQGTSTRPEILSYKGDSLKMYEKIVETVKSEVLAMEEIVLVSPTGTAIQNARTSFVGDTLTRDGYHLSYALGRYIAGLTFVRALTGLPIDEIGFIPQGINDDAAAVAIESVNNAIQKPYQVTPSIFT